MPFVCQDAQVIRRFRVSCFRRVRPRAARFLNRSFLVGLESSCKRLLGGLGRKYVLHPVATTQCQNNYQSHSPLAGPGGRSHAQSPRWLVTKVRTEVSRFLVEELLGIQRRHAAETG